MNALGFPIPASQSAGGRRSGARGAFTLIELLVVIGIIVLVAIIAVPSFRALTGGRSTEAAQNQISAVLARARTEALGLEEPRGVLFYRDLETQRIGMVMVRPSNTAAPYQLDLVPDREPILLPQGVGIQFIDNYASTAGTPPVRTDDGYIGFNTVVRQAGPPFSSVVPYGGVVLFDRQGRVTNETYAFRLRYDTPVARAAAMGRFLTNNPNLAVAGDQFVEPAPELAESKLGFVLFDAEEFNNVHGEGRTVAKNTDTDTQVAGNGGNGDFVAGGERDEEKWLDDNAVPVLVNRYNGTLIRGE